MINYVQRGETLDVIAPYAVTSGAGVRVGNKFGVAAVTAASGASLAIAVVGVFDLAKDASTFTDGSAVFWDNTNLVATSALGAGNILIGVANLNKPDGTVAPGGSTSDPTVRVRLNGSFTDGIGFLASVSLTAAQVIAMNATPVSVLAAPAAGMAIVVDSILFEMTTTSTQFTGGGAVSFVYHGTSTAVHAGTIPATVVTATAGSSNTLLGPAVATNGTTVPAATGVDITNATAAFAAGTGTVKVQVKYRLLTL
jgi:predicted RecA/RadA family phage recombinase